MSAANEITEELKSLDSMLAELPRTMPYSVPAGYFDELPAAIAASIAASTTETFSVPEGYFEQFPQQMLAAAKQADKKPLLIALAGHVRWVAAAVLIICIGAGSYMTFLDQPRASAEGILSSVPASDINDYLQSNYRSGTERATNVATLNNLQLDSKEIERYLNETGWE
jgi:hypothetical protein